jgi:hypothetical protein
VPVVFPSNEPAKEPWGARSPGMGERRAFARPGHETLAFPFLAGRTELAVRLAARPLFDLRRRVRIGVHVSRILSRAAPAAGPFGGSRPRLEPADIQRMDTATLNRAIDSLRAAEGEAIVVPACWSTVASSRGRFSLLYAGLDHEPDVARLLMEIVGLPPRVDPDEIANVASHIEAQRRGVLLRSPPDLQTVAHLARAGLKGLSLDLSTLDLTGIAGRQTASQLIRTARLSAGQVLVLGLPAELAEDAAQAGATHAVMEERFTVTV